MQQLKTYNTYKAFVNAFAGVNYFLRHERNGRYQIIIGVFAVILSILLHIKEHEWMIVLLCIGTVLSAEMMNSALEKLCDYVQPSFNLQIKVIKDMAAGAVLLICIASVITGALIFFLNFGN